MVTSLIGGKSLDLPEDETQVNLNALLRKYPTLFEFKQRADLIGASVDRLLGRTRSWSQHGEDGLLIELLGELIHTGFYVDVGANHPVKTSNTYRLYSLGMRGLTIEPNCCMALLHQQFRPGDTQLCAGVSDHDGVEMFYEMDYHAFSTFSAEACRALLAQGRTLIRTSAMPVVTLATILNKFECSGRDHFALLCVDTEGLDHAVLSGNDWEKHRPQVIVCEQWEEGDRSPVRDLLSSHGYVFHRRYGCNDLYLKGS